MKKRVLRIEKEFCKECGLCINICPDKALDFSDKFNAKGYHPIHWKGNCRLCGLCYQVCPDCVIEIVEESGSGSEPQ